MQEPIEPWVAQAIRGRGYDIMNNNELPTFKGLVQKVSNELSGGVVVEGLTTATVESILLEAMRAGLIVGSSKSGKVQVSYCVTMPAAPGYMTLLQRVACHEFFANYALSYAYQMVDTLY